jgi:hypothetical protein
MCKEAVVVQVEVSSQPMPRENEENHGRYPGQDSYHAPSEYKFEGLSFESFSSPEKVKD